MIEDCEGRAALRGPGQRGAPRAPCRGERRGWVAAACLLAASLGSAQEITFFRGRTWPLDGSDPDHNGQIELRYQAAPHLAWSVSYLNEGSPPGHRRDGLAAQLWGTAPLPGGRASLAIGAGVYRAFDTIQGEGRDTFNRHAWLGLYSVSAAYRAWRSLLLRLTASRVAAGGNSGANALELGVGFRLRDGGGEPGKPDDGRGQRPPSIELMPFIGRTRANTLGAPKGIARGLEARLGLAAHLEWTVAWLDEGGTTVTRRRGLASQLWLADAFVDRRLLLAIGVGGYGFRDRDRPAGTGAEHGELYALGVGWRFQRRWSARFNWYRVATRYDRDADVFALGLGWRPGR